MKYTKNITNNHGQIKRLTLDKKAWDVLDYTHDFGFDIYLLVAACELFTDKKYLDAYGLDTAIEYWCHWLSLKPPKKEITVHLTKRKYRLDSYICEPDS